MLSTVVIFGEAERGRFHMPLALNSLEEVYRSLGNPPSDSNGIYFAIQTMLYDHRLIYFRVEEEGYNIKDYMVGFQLLKEGRAIQNVDAIGLPGVGSNEIIDSATLLSHKLHCLLLTREKDLYDYLTEAVY